MKIAQLHQKFLICSGADTDTRKIRNNSMFFALRGDNFDGNLFAAEALKKGARYVVVDDKKIAEKNESYILVKDSLQTLQNLALFHRKYLGLTVLAITGSNGKTTTKELINSVLSKKYRTVATKGNLNNHIGVPLTLLSMDSTTEIGIVEMGANHINEIGFLCSLANPDYGYITNFGKAHLEGFGSIEGVIQGKTELYKALQENKKLVFLNADDSVQEKHLNYGHTFSFGETEKANVKIQYDTSSSKASLKYNETLFESNHLIGSYNAINMAAALCIGLYFKVHFQDIKESLKNYSPTNSRSQIMEAGNNTILMDAYNANPTSMYAALENFNSITTPKHKVAILGDMFELGEAADHEHQMIVNFVDNSSINEIYLLGDHFQKVQTNSNFIMKFRDIESLKKHIKEGNFYNTYFLIKGSRGMALERVLEDLGVISET